MFYKRHGHSANLIANSVYLFGGSSDFGHENDIHRYDIKDEILSELTAKGNIPSVREYHGSAVIKDNLYIFGGSEFRGILTNNTLYCFNTKSTEWVDIPVMGGSPPSSRTKMSMFSFENKLYIFGGFKEFSVAKDFNEFNLKTCCWSELSENQ